MKLILLDGGPASGKNTLGALLVRKLQDHGDKAMLLDLDTYIEQLNPTWIWNDKAKEENDQRNARANFAEAIDNYLRQKYIVIAIGSSRNMMSSRPPSSTSVNRRFSPDDTTCAGIVSLKPSYSSRKHALTNAGVSGMSEGVTPERYRSKALKNRMVDTILRYVA